AVRRDDGAARGGRGWGRRAEGLDGQPPAGARATRLGGIAAPGPTPDRAAESERLRPLLQRALLSLPADQREVFILREQAGLPFREIAEVVGANENTVKSRMRYALLGLRKALLAAGVDGEAAGPS